jgi:hypothetical protein
MQSSLRFAGMISLLILLAGGLFMLNERRHTTAAPLYPASMKKGVPLIDRDVPAVIETATFALG